MNRILKNKNLPRRILFHGISIVNKISLWGKKEKTFLAVLFFAVILVLAVPNSAHAYFNPVDWFKKMAEDSFVLAIKWILFGINTLMGMLLSIATTLFATVVDPANISGTNGLLNKQAVKDVWIMVRDVLNMFFILVLLFSAFCTIFQVEKWNIKKVWLNVLINALLVNFSLPIARLIIDISNVAMYYFLNHLFAPSGTATTVTGSLIFSSFADVSKLSAILMPKGFMEADIAYQIAMIIFTFILGMTLMVVAVLFVVRLIALTMLVMFSPVGFVGYIFPATAKYASDWWTQLFSYSFFAPIMIFIMAIALRIAQAMGNENSNSFTAYAGANTVGSASMTWIASAAFFTIPIIVLWMGMGVAKSLGIAGAETVVGKAKGFSKTVAGWAGSGAKWATYGNPLARGVKEGVKEKAGINKMIKWWKAPSKIEAGVKGGIVGLGSKTKGGLVGGAKSELEKLRYKEIQDAVEEHKKNKTSHSQLVLDLDNKDKVKARAAAMALAENDDIRNKTELTKGLAALSGDANLTSKFIQKGHSAIQDVGSLTSALQALGDDSKSMSTLIEKVGPGAMDMNQADYANILSTTGVNEKQLNSRLKKEGQIQTLVEYEHAVKGASYDNAYEKHVADMTPKDLANQKESMHNNANFINYVISNSGANQTFSAEHRKNVFAEMSGKKKAIWAANGMQP